MGITDSKKTSHLRKNGCLCQKQTEKGGLDIQPKMGRLSSSQFAIAQNHTIPCVLACSATGFVFNFVIFLSSTIADSAWDELSRLVPGFCVSFLLKKIMYPCNKYVRNSIQFLSVRDCLGDLMDFLVSLKRIPSGRVSPEFLSTQILPDFIPKSC